MAGSFEFSVTTKNHVLVPPDSETPKGLYYLSNLDQNIAVMVKTLYYFKSESRTNQESYNVIKKSLSEVLVHYYPVAGRLTISSEGKIAVNCTGEGVVLVEAETNGGIEMIKEAISENKMEKLDKLVYDVTGARNILEIPPLVVQVTNLKCGGFVLGLSMSHNMFDGVAAAEFLNSWCEIAKGLPLSVPPFLDRTILRPRNPPKIEFPHNEFDEIEDISGTGKLYDDEKLVYKSFLFEPAKLKKLKNMAMKDNNNKVTTFQALTGFLWKSRCEALRFKPDQRVKLLFAADGRSRFVPPLPVGYCGNGIVLTGLVTSSGELVGNNLSHAAGLVKRVVDLVTDGFLRSAMDYLELNRTRPSLTATLLITSWSKLTLHKLDFGWGEPVFSGPVGLPGREVILFLPGGEDMKSINVFLGLPASAIEVFEELMKI
uniref:Omega-hydroxypalmitate O-feruloyl transferase n=2 Tax=Noccaea caerulescens TaxID=107243 RepID=A0A1J3K9E6_NOCCA